MSFAEAFLRLASAVVGWLVIYAHCLTVAVAPIAECGEASNDPFVAATFTGAASVFFSLVIPLGRSVPGVGQALRFLSVPALLLLALALRALLPLFDEVTFKGANLCTKLGTPAPDWHASWAPFQMFTLFAVAVAAFRVWRTQGEER